MELFAKLVISRIRDEFTSFTIFTKNSIKGVWQSPKYAFEFDVACVTFLFIINIALVLFFMESFSKHSSLWQTWNKLMLMSFLEKFNCYFFLQITIRSLKKFGKKLRNRLRKLFFFFDETGFQYVKCWRVSKNTVFPCYMFSSYLLPSGLEVRQTITFLAYLFLKIEDSKVLHGNAIEVEEDPFNLMIYGGLSHLGCAADGTNQVFLNLSLVVWWFLFHANMRLSTKKQFQLNK